MAKKFALTLGIPSAAILLGIVTSRFADPLITNNDGIGDGRALLVLGTVAFAALSIVVSFVVGALVQHFTKNERNPKGSILGYVVPVSLFFLVELYEFISVVIIGNSTPY